MSIAKGALRTAVLQYMDAVNSARWAAAAGGEVDLRIGSVYDRLWRRILSANRFYRVAKRTPTSDAVTGRYLVSDLTQGTGNSIQRFHRILVVIIDGRGYEQGSLTEWALADGTETGVMRCIWYQEGSNLNALPIQTSKLADAIWVNWIPPRPGNLDLDNATVDFPDGYEEVLIAHAAARLLTKGGAETQAARDLKNEVEEDFQEMLADIARVSTNPLQVQYTDTAIEWGGV